MPKTTFSPGSVIDSQWLNAIQNLNFLGNDVNGSYPPITDDSFSSAAGNVKPEWRTFRDALRVTATSQTGLSISYQGGAITLESGLISTIAPATIVVADNVVTFVFINSAGSVATSTTQPSRWFPMARVTSAGGNVTAIVDLRERFRIAPISRAVAAFGSGGFEGDLTISTNQSLSGVRYLRNFTIDSGATLTVNGGFLQIKASGNITINGIINVAAIVSGGVGITGVLNANVQYFGEPGSGLGRSGGINLPPPLAYPYQASAGLGSGGSVGFIGVGSAGAAQVTSSKAGNGGGAIWLEAAGTITINGTIVCDGSAAIAPSIGATSVSVACSGASGGTGGTIWLGSLTSIQVGAAAVLQVRGGASSPGARANATNTIGGTGGASGGYLVLFSPSTNVNALAQLNVQGGAGSAVLGTVGDSIFVGSTSGPSFANSGGGTNLATAQPGTNGGSGQILQFNFTPV